MGHQRLEALRVDDRDAESASLVEFRTRRLAGHHEIGLATDRRGDPASERLDQRLDLGSRSSRQRSRDHDRLACERAGGGFTRAGANLRFGPQPGTLQALEYGWYSAKLEALAPGGTVVGTLDYEPTTFGVQVKENTYDGVSPTGSGNVARSSIPFETDYGITIDNR